MIIQKPHLCTTIEIWSPKYGDVDEWEAWVSQFKVTHASPIIIIKFTKAKHLIGQRFAVRREIVERCEKTTNGKIPVYRVPLSKMEYWETPKEIHDIIDSFGWSHIHFKHNQLKQKQHESTEPNCSSVY